MDLKRLETFRVVAQTGSLRNAAAQIGLSLSAVSIQIKKLEQDMGIKLFDHLPNKLVLTERGRCFLNELDLVFAALERATAAALGDRDAHGASVSVILENDLSKYFSQQIAAFAKNNPRINLVIQSRSSYKGLAMLVDKEIDMSIGFYQTVPSGIERICLRRSGMSLVYPRGLSFCTGSVLDHIANNRLITLARPSTIRGGIDAVLASKNISTEGMIEVGSCQAILEFVQLGLGLGLAHDVCVGAQSYDKVSVMDVSEHFGTVDIALASREETLSWPAHQAFANALAGGVAKAHAGHAYSSHAHAS